MSSKYVFAASVQDALENLKSAGGSGRIIAGGTDLTLQVKQGKQTVDSFVDITHIPELKGIRELDDGVIWVGATVTHRELWESPIIQKRARLLADACRAVGANQIQNIATIGGNVVNAMPAADGSIALTALDAEVQITTASGSRWEDLQTIFSQPGTCKVEPTEELLTAFRFRGLDSCCGSSFQRLARRKALSLPILNCGVVVQLDEAGEHFQRAAIALGPIAAVPFRARRAEALLAGKPISEETIAAAALEAMRESNPRSSLFRASREYRQEMVDLLTRRALTEAVERALA